MAPSSDALRSGAGRALGAIPAQAVRIGGALVSAGLISREQLAQALELQKEWGSRLGDILLGMGWVKPQAFYRALADSSRLLAT